MRKILWCVIFFIPTFIFIICPALFVFLVDPLWQWSHPLHLERWHRGFNERIQKTNYLASRRVNIDTLIVGSSRSTYFRPEWLGTENGFNYAVSSGKPSEFAAQINYVKKRSNIPLKLVMIESSFGATFKTKNTFESPAYYIENAEDVGKKFRNLFSRDVYNRAKSASKKAAHAYYFIDKFGTLRYKVNDRKYKSADEKQRAIDHELKNYREKVYNMPKDAYYSQYISEIHDASGKSEIIVWTPPISKYLMKLFCDMGRLDDYELWLRMLVAEYGTVYHFTYPNSITMNDANFYDSQHPTGATAELTIKIITELKNSGKTENKEYGGIVMTNKNIDSYLKILRKELGAL